jgi:predicted N-acetyltransferase YhbS
MMMNVFNVEKQLIDLSTKLNVTLRNESPADYKTVENLTREAFWNMYMSGCDEHFVLHNLRSSPDYIKELDFVAELDGKIIGNIVYAKASIQDDATKCDIIGFGPISVLPEYQNKGIGSQLITHTVKLAKDNGYKAIVILGDPAYYSRFGFKPGKDYNISMPNGSFLDALQVLELYPNALQGVKGRFIESTVYEDIDANAVEVFDKQFSHKEKGIPKKPINMENKDNG